ncbi:type II toxin-antitoxin system VapC family toxin [Actibacterium sp. 188UL27-1]|uniref:type II toxin-antitoxin system VapC family toxin n=1 Tax=Actibacterium sp. 188UL27-1 TaxID=2786961 RepID=UPI001EF54552|nr:type II toxin-antitoxin system VapC family toxin [Actibacterium sp. 188UL27-1]
MRFLFDTNAVISLLGQKSEALLDRVFDCSEGDIGLPAIVSHELYFGAYKSQKVSFNLETIRLLVKDFVLLPFDDEDARQAGEIRADLKRAGTPIGPYDILIAGQARARDLILVSNNVREFERVRDLQLEDWTAT